MPVTRARSFVVVLFGGLLLAASCTSTTSNADQIQPTIEKDQEGELDSLSTSPTTTSGVTSQIDTASSAVPQVVPVQATPNETGILIGSGALTTLTLNGTQIQFTTSLEFENPRFFSDTVFGDMSKEVWGRVLIHNLERDLAGADPYGLVDGRNAVRLNDFYGNPDDPYQVAVSAGSWWIDISLHAGDPSQQEALREEFLSGLTITERDGDIPLVEDAAGWILGFNTVTVASEQSGFMLAINPNCNPTDPTCKPNVGSLLPGLDHSDRILGARRDRARSERVMAYPADFEIQIVDLGPMGELVSCTGFPAFDPLLLSKGLSFGDATEETRTYTGIKVWDRHYQPGIETWFVGDPEGPEVVATYVSNEDGTWDTRSVLTCQ